MVRKRDFVKASAKFHNDGPSIVPIGTKLFHVGSLLGQDGSNSMTSGIMSQVGRVIDLGKADGTVFDQTTVTAFPGSSGGGVFVAGEEKEMVKHRGQYCGMLVRGAGETFNLIVPVRRMITWAKDNNCSWALDESAKTPTMSELNSHTWVVEDNGTQSSHSYSDAEENNKKYGLKFLLQTNEKDFSTILKIKP